MIKNNVVLPRRVIPQPTPFLYSGGDCGACVLGGITGQPLETVYKTFQPKEPKPNTFSWYEMRNALHLGCADGIFDRVIVESPTWRGPIEAMAHWGSPSWTQTLPWFAYVKMAFDAGYYALAMVSHAKQGPWQSPDHWVMLCGARDIYPDDGPGAIDHEVLVSCSSRATPDEEWVEIGDFLEKRGGFNCFFARPA